MKEFALVVAALLVSAPLPADPVETFRSEVAKAREAEEKLIGDGQSRFAGALRLFVLPWERGHSDPKAPQDGGWDYAPFRALYAEIVAIAEARGAAAEKLADSADPRAARTLFEELLGVAIAADGAEAELAKDMPLIGQQMCDLRPGLRRHGLGRLERRLVPALARCPGASVYLVAEGWKRAVAGDGRGSILRRVAVLDALGILGDEGALSFLAKSLESKSAVVRIAAMEGLLRRRESAPSLFRLLADPSPVVRLALLQDLRRSKVDDPQWIRPLLDAYPAAKGRARAAHLSLLRILTGQGFGDDPAKWKAWLAANGAAVDTGTLEVRSVTDPPAGTPFYGSRAESLAPIFAVDGSFVLHLPAEVEIQRTKHVTRWPHRPKAAWSDPPVVHFSVLVREMKKALDGLPAEARFGLLGLYGKNGAFPFEDGRMLRPGPKVVADALKFCEGLGQAGRCAPYEALLAAMDLAGLDSASGADDFPRPVADLVFLVHGGGPSGGRYVTWEPVVEAVNRRNRFRRLEVHAVRISNQKEEAEQTLKGIAEASGGSYRWAMAPP